MENSEFSKKLAEFKDLRICSFCDAKSEVGWTGVDGPHFCFNHLVKAAEEFADRVGMPYVELAKISQKDYNDGGNMYQRVLSVMAKYWNNQEDFQKTFWEDAINDTIRNMHNTLSRND